MLLNGSRIQLGIFLKTQAMSCFSLEWNRRMSEVPDDSSVPEFLQIEVQDDLFSPKVISISSVIQAAADSPRVPPPFPTNSKPTSVSSSLPVQSEDVPLSITKAPDSKDRSSSVTESPNSKTSSFSSITEAPDTKISTFSNVWPSLCVINALIDTIVVDGDINMYHQ